jgi:signal transduction histidine kinase
LDGKVLAHGANRKLVGRDLMGFQDVDGKLFIKAMIEAAAKQDAFWEDFKYVNPQSKKIEPKQMYCNRIDTTIVCAGVYKS